MELPNKPRGVPRVDDRHVPNGIFWVLRIRFHGNEHIIQVMGSHVRSHASGTKSFQGFSYIDAVK